MNRRSFLASLTAALAVPSVFARAEPQKLLGYPVVLDPEAPTGMLYVRYLKTKHTLTLSPETMRRCGLNPDGSKMNSSQLNAAFASECDRALRRLDLEVLRTYGL